MYTDSHAKPTGALRSDEAYRVLKEGLLIGEFPLNTRMGEERLATRLGVSRTPVREALMRLHAEGIIRRGADGGYEPTAPDVALMRHLYEVRGGLELQALRRPARLGERHDPAVLERLHEEWQALADDDDNIEPDPGFVLLDESFHLTLAEAAGNAVLVELLGQVNDRIRVVRMQDFLEPGRITNTIAEHLALLGAVLEGDLARAEVLFSEHLDGSVAVVADRVGRAITRMASGGEAWR